MLSDLTSALTAALAVTIIGFPFGIGIRRPEYFKGIRLIYEAILISSGVLVCVAYWSYTLGYMNSIAHILKTSPSAEQLATLSKTPIKEPMTFLFPPVLALAYCAALRIYGVLLIDEN